MVSRNYPDGDSPRTMFVVFQTANKANGGVESLTQLIESGAWRGLIVTQRITSVNERWWRAGLRVDLWSIPYQVGTSFIRAELRVRIMWLFSLLRNNWLTWKLVRREKIAVIHCNDPAPFWHVVIGAWLSRVPVLLNLRDTKRDLHSFPVERYQKRFRWCAAVLVLSREMASFYESAVGIQFLKSISLRIDSIYSIVATHKMKPLDLLERNRLRKELGIRETEFAIGFVAAFNDMKNQLDFVNNTGTRLKQFPDVRVHFVGDFRPETDDYARNCELAVLENGYQASFSFAGYSSEVDRWYQALDVLVVPTRHEGLARCMIEALSSGLPVVSFDVCSAKEILEPTDCGVVVSQGDYENLFDSLMVLAKDPLRRKEMGNRGRQLAEQKFSAEEVVKSYRALYSRVAVSKD